MIEKNIHSIFPGGSKQVTVNRCENIVDFNDRTSSLKTSGCVMLYSDGCCQGTSIKATGDLSTVPATFDDKLTSLSPCDEYHTPSPNSIQEKWLGHSQLMTKMVEDGDIAIYYNDQVTGNAVENHREYLKRVWAHVKQTYGFFGPEGGRVAAFMHANVQGVPGYGFNSLQNYFDITSDCRNLIDLVQGGADGWSRNLTGNELDVFTHEVSHIVEGASKRYHGSPSYQLWGDSKWAEIFNYDVYSALGMDSERDRWFQLMQTSHDNYPRENTYWFRDWFYPIYSRHGGARLLNEYFNTLATHFPKNPNGWQYDGRSINLGEFVHFFSGAAATDLKPQAVIAFKWDDAAERELQQAKIDFPNIKY